MRYSTFDRELLAAFSAVKHFRFFLEGRPFTHFSDHKPLISAISKAKTPFSSLQQRQLSIFLEFTTTLSTYPAINTWWPTHFLGHLSQPQLEHL
jgi:hypothetical protein